MNLLVFADVLKPELTSDHNLKQQRRQLERWSVSGSMLPAAAWRAPAPPRSLRGVPLTPWSALFLVCLNLVMEFIGNKYAGQQKRRKNIQRFNDPLVRGQAHACAHFHCLILNNKAGERRMERIGWTLGDGAALRL